MSEAPANPEGESSGPPRSALLTGLSGQDGSFLAEQLLQRGYQVSAVVHGAVDRTLGHAEPLRERVRLLAGDLLAPESLRAGVLQTRPREIYHLGGPSYVPASWDRPELTQRAIVGSTAALLEAMCTLRRDTGEAPRLFLAASGSMFGEAAQSPQREDTPPRPITPYAIAKLAAHQLAGAYRRDRGLYACSGILYNHESERRGVEFVSRRITHGAAAISLGLAEDLTLGDLGAVRDWSFAGDITRGAWMMLQPDSPEDFILASGIPHTVAELAHTAFACVGLDAERYLRVESDLVRPPESTPSVGDPTKARTQLGWKPQVDFQQLIERMVQADVRALQGQIGKP